MVKKISYSLSDYNKILESEVYYKDKKMFWITFSIDVYDYEEDYYEQIPISRIIKACRMKENQEDVLNWGLNSINCLEMHTSDKDVEYCLKQDFVKVKNSNDVSKTQKDIDGVFFHMKFYHN